MSSQSSMTRVRAAASIVLLALGAFACGSDSTGPGAVVARLRIADPTGDTLDNSDPTIDPGLDIRQTAVYTRGDSVFFVIHFNDNVTSPAANAFNSVYGFIDIDTDENDMTGTGPASDYYFGGYAGIGVDYYIDFTVGSTTAQIDDGNGNVLALARAAYAGDSAMFKLRRADLGNDDGNFNFTVTVGTAYWASDIAPNDGHYQVRTNATASVAPAAMIVPRLSVAGGSPRKTHPLWVTR